MNRLWILGSLLLTLDGTSQETPPITNEILLRPHFTLQKSYDITFTGDALFWTANEEGLDYVITNTPGLTAINQDGVVERGSFDWDWGFRIGIGYKVPDQKMDLGATWTRYFTHGLSQVNSTLPPAIFSVWTSALSNISNQRHATMNSYLQFNMLDLKLSTTFSPRKFLDITPFIDVCAAWVDQKFAIDVYGGNNNNSFGSTVLGDQFKMTNRFWGVGPKIGFDTLWILGYGFSIYSNFDVSLLYGRFHVSQNETTTTEGVSPPVVYLDINKNNFSLSRLNLDLMIGLKWMRLFANDAYLLTLEAGWEELILLGQNQLMRFFSPDTSATPALNSSGKGDLTLQGLTMQAGLTF
jgi:hypothetical protein